jgi:hypothetical protein
LTARKRTRAAIEHAARRIRVLGATTRPGGDRVVPQARNLLMDLDDAGGHVKFVLHDREWIGTCRRELLDRTLIWNLPRLPRCPRPSPTSTTSARTDTTVSAEVSTNINRQPDQHG